MQPSERSNSLQCHADIFTSWCRHSPPSTYGATESVIEEWNVWPMYVLRIQWVVKCYWNRVRRFSHSPSGVWSNFNDAPAFEKSHSFGNVRIIEITSVLFGSMPSCIPGIAVMETHEKLGWMGEKHALLQSGCHDVGQARWWTCTKLRPSIVVWTWQIRWKDEYGLSAASRPELNILNLRKY